MTEVLAHGVKLTDTAVSKVKALLAAEGRDDLRLRVAVEPGGCSGLMYNLEFDSEHRASDHVFEDNGVGMDEKTRQRVLEPFYTTKETYSGQGLGLGLPVSASIIRGLGGEISLRAGQEKGWSGACP